MGNPPFNGQYTKSFEQTADMKLVWGTQYDGYLDYLTAWFNKKASDYFEAVNGGRFAFVSTNSIAPESARARPVRPSFRCWLTHPLRPPTLISSTAPTCL